MKAIITLLILFVSARLSSQDYQNLVSQADQIVTINHLSSEPIDSIFIGGVKHYFTEFTRIAPSFYSKYGYETKRRLLYRTLPDRRQSHAHYGKWIAFLKCETGACIENPNFQLNNRGETNYYGYHTIMDGGLIPFSLYDKEKIESYLPSREKTPIPLENLFNYADYVAHIKTDSSTINEGMGITQEAGTNWLYVSFKALENFKIPSDEIIKNSDPLNARVTYGITKPLPLGFWIVHGYNPIPREYLDESKEYLVFLRCGYTSIGNEFLGNPSRIGDPCLSSMIVLNQGVKPFTPELQEKVNNLVENGRNKGDCSNVHEEFEDYINQTLEEPSMRFKDFIPAPPRLPCFLFAELQTELISDSAKYYFDQLHTSKNLHLSTLVKSIGYFKRKKLPFCLQACTFHWNPDVRVRAAEYLFQHLTIKYKIKASDSWMWDFYIEERILLKSCLYLLDNYPGPMSGSENITIHGFYRNQLIKCIRSICGELNINTKPETIGSTGAYSKEDFNRWKSQIYKKYGE